jgi:hypothetical protein
MSPDITMCVGIGCPYKEKCYRYSAKPSEFLQSWFMETPIKDGKCDMFWGDNAEAVWNQLKDIVKGKV